MKHGHVEMTHPTMPGRTIRVAPCEVPRLDRAGWQVLTAAEPAAVDDETTHEGNAE